MKKTIEKICSRKRYNTISEWILGSSLDIGSRYTQKIFTKTCDISPIDKKMEYQDIHKLTYKNNQFDTVSCLQVLEHVKDPPQAIRELMRVAKKRIIISVPIEPSFTLCRGPLGWNKEHLWAIRPELLKLYLGNPIYEKRILIRWYLGVWNLSKDKAIL